MIWFQIFWEFFKAGLFAAGGGLATLPFLYAISESTGWFSTADIANMIAISESTPGPLGVNMATYAGYQTLGIAGGIWATLSLTSPALFVITAVSKALDKFKNALLVEKIFYGLRPCSIALITAAGLGVAKISLLNIKNDIPAPNILSFFDWKCILLAVIMWYALWRFKKHPVFTLPFPPPSASSLNCNLNSSIPPGQISHQKTRSHVGYRAFLYSFSANNHSCHYRKCRSADRNDIHCRLFSHSGKRRIYRLLEIMKRNHVCLLHQFIFHISHQINITIFLHHSKSCRFVSPQFKMLLYFFNPFPRAYYMY